MFHVKGLSSVVAWSAVMQGLVAARAAVRLTIGFDALHGLHQLGHRCLRRKPAGISSVEAAGHDKSDHNDARG